jgi:site-specific recombinase XerD
VLTRCAEEGALSLSLGHPLLDDYLAFVGARCRPNTLLATGHDLNVFFRAVGKEPADVVPADVFGFITSQRSPPRGPKVVRLEDGEKGLSSRTIKRRLASVSGFYAYLVARDDAGLRASPVPRGLSTRWAGGARVRTVPLLRTPRTLPRVLAPAEVDALLAALRTHRDRAMVEAMLLGGLRRCEVLGTSLDDVSPGDRRLRVRHGKGGHERLVPVSGLFSASLADYIANERPAQVATKAVFVVLKGPRRGRPLSAAGVDEILAGARQRAGLRQATCHMLRHTCFTRLREAGMALEALQAQAGHRSINSTRVYLHLADSRLAGEYSKAVEALEAEVGTQHRPEDEGAP